MSSRDFDKQMKEFGEQMGRWGEQWGRQAGHWGSHFGRRAGHWGRHWYAFPGSILGFIIMFVLVGFLVSTAFKVLPWLLMGLLFYLGFKYLKGGWGAWSWHGDHHERDYSPTGKRKNDEPKERDYRDSRDYIDLDEEYGKPKRSQTEII